MKAMTPAELMGALRALAIDDSDANSKGWSTTECPACGKPGLSSSLRVNVQSGIYRCYRCNAASADGGKTLAEFVVRPGAPSLSARRASSGELPPLSQRMIDRMHDVLVGSPGVMQDLQRKRGWKESTIKRLKLGWDGAHLWIPIYNIEGELVNARMYDPFRRTRIKSMHYRNETGMQRTAVWIPFGAESLSDTIWMFEGEPDGILAAQEGLPVVLITGGAGTWDDQILTVIKKRKVVVCYDMDAAGERGARSIIGRLRAAGIEDVVRMTFELNDADNNDFTDAIIKEGWSVSRFKQKADKLFSGEVVGDGEPPAPPIPVSLGGGVPGEPVLVKAHVLSASTVPMLVPHTVQATCNQDWRPDGACRSCPMNQAGGSMVERVEPDSQDIPTLCSTPQTSHARVFIAMMGIPLRCPRIEVETAGHWAVHPIKLVPPMTERTGGDSTMRSAIYVSAADGVVRDVRSNQLYEFMGHVRSDTKTNEWLLVAPDARPAEDDVDSFRLNSALIEELSSWFRPDKWTVESVEETFIQEERSLARHVTKVYGRNMLLRLIDLVYHSVLSFKFKGDSTTRGWLSAAIIGDTRTGKSETMTSFMRHMGLGKMVMDPANTTYAGLVGGLQQVGGGDKAWTITWGMIPTNDRGLIAIDEVSSLSADDIGKMSGMRSSGIAELTKIRSASTPARTRMIMSGNPRGHGKTLRSFGTAVEGLMELIGAPEDVARFDMAMAVGMGLDKDEENKKLGKQAEPAPSDLRRDLVRFAWSRTMSQIEWEEGAEISCVKLARGMIADFSMTIPLVEPSEQDLKVARLAVAVAIRTFSIKDDDPNIVIVRTCHVEFAVKTMRVLYGGDLAYKSYSEFLSRQTLDKERVTTLMFNKCLNGTGIEAISIMCRSMLKLRRVNPNSIGMMLGLDGNEARQFMSAMAQSGACEFAHADRGRNTAMEWTPEFVSLLRDMEQNPPELPTEDLAAF
jgi:hypothetical protein